MTLLQRWRFQPAFPCPPCIPLSRCCPDRPQPWHRLPRDRLVFLRRVAMGTCFLLAWISRVVRGFRGRGSIKHCPVLMVCLIGESQLGAWFGFGSLRERAWCLRESAFSRGGSCCQARSKRPVEDGYGSWTRRPEAPVP